MYKQISIKNLKIFKNEQKLKIAPITLLYGENSSGKTSLLKTFDIVHNIFSEGQVKRGKNVSQKDSPFYRNENIQNISAKNIHYYSNQVNKKDIDIKILLDVLTNNRNILNTLKILNEKPISINRTLGLDKINIDNYNIDDGYLNIPLNISIKIKHFKKKEISKVDKIEIQSSLGKSLINFSRINKEYKKIDQVFDKDKVGYLSPNFNKILIRPNRYSGSFNRGRPVAEEDYFVDEALYADYKVSIKEKTIWKNLYKNYVKIFTNNSEIKSRYEKIKNIFNTLNNFDNWKLKSSKNFNNIKINFEDFAYFIAKFYLSGEMPKIFFSNNKIKKWFRPRFSSVEDILNNLDNKEVCYNIKQIVLKDLTRFNNLTSAQLSGIPQDKINCPNCGTKYKIDINLVPRTGRTLQCSKCKNTWKFKIKKKFKYDDEEKLFLKNFLLAKRISNSKCINKILIKNKLEKKK